MTYCRRCGCRLARDHEDDEWCSPCLRRMRDYDPRDDPLFLVRLLAVLRENEGCTIEPLKHLGIGYEHRQFVKDAVKSLRRRGYDIRASERTAGYRYVGEFTSTQTTLPLGFTITATLGSSPEARGGVG